MKLILAVLVTLLGFAAATAAEEKKQPARKEVKYNPKAISVNKPKSDPVKWEGPEFDAAKTERKAKQKTKGKK